MFTELHEQPASVLGVFLYVPSSGSDDPYVQLIIHMTVMQSTPKKLRVTPATHDISCWIQLDYGRR
jgi:hypothetical protein